MLFNSIGFSQYTVTKQDEQLLFLHGLFSNGEHSSKANALRFAGYDVTAPPLNNWCFWWACHSVKLDQIKPDVIVGSSRGGAIALNLDTNLPLVLLAPAWKYYGMKKDFTNPCVIIHGKNDTLIPYEDSIELVNMNPNARLYIVNDDHQLNKYETHRLMIQQVKQFNK